jgi:GNAT superfamily N-acetyltransferase
VAFIAGREPDRARELIPGLAHLWMLFIREPWWGSGLARRLHAMAIAEAAGQGYRGMRLYTPAGQARARAFYEREGWATDGVARFEPMLALDLVEYRRGLP